MPRISDSQRPGRERLNVRLILSALVSLGLVAIVFTILVIQIQFATTAYLSGLAVWSRGQVESVRQSNIYARTGNPEALEKARSWYEIPYGDMEARPHMAGADFDFDAAYDGLLRGANHPDDIPRMIMLFRVLNDAPYFRDAIKAWQESDLWLLKLGEMMNELEQHWQENSVDTKQLAALQEELDVINQRLASEAAEFRNKMSLASRSLVTILSVTSVVFFILLSGIATLLIKKLIAATRSSERKFRKTFENAAMGIAQLDSDGVITEANEALIRILKYPHKTLVSQPLKEFVYPEDQHTLRQGYDSLASGDRESLSLKQRFCCGDSSLVWAKTTLSRFDETTIDGLRYVCILEDVSEQHRLSEELNYQARHDALTGLINRHAFEGYLEAAVIRARSENFVHCLCFIDLDRFKIVNDTSGHFVGDQVLQQVTQRFSQHLRKSDLLARLGGDEFGLILDCCEPEAAVTLAGSLMESLNESPFAWEDKRFSIGCSIGIVPITAASNDAADLLQAADSACNMAKEQGRNRILLTHQDDQELAARRTQMEWLERIREAIAKDRLFLDAQHIVPLTSDSKPRIEVLLRMYNENDEVVPPGAFLPAAERFGIAHLLDRWVIERVCSHLSSTPELANNLEACHINISGRSFDHDDFTYYATNTLKEYQVPAEKICFEITETAAISNLNDVQEFMATLKEAGATFALDDFGAGLSSFAYLKQLPVQYLKIDGSFVRHMARDETDRAMVRAITDIGQTLGKKLVAEFVEDQASLEWLESMGVEFAQGYHLHRPERLDNLVVAETESKADSSGST